MFTARPPELIALAALPTSEENTARAIVHPEALLSADQERLFSEIAPGARVQTLTESLEECRWAHPGPR